MRNIFFKILLVSLFIGGIATANGQNSPKHEFRGAWIQTMFQGDYMNLSVEELKSDLIKKLDDLKLMGINALVFQVRPESDAWYNSPYEPWSRFLSGKQGKAPADNFDPMSFLIAECHKRCMEFHAWLNPYRAASGGGVHLAPSHIYHKHPEWFFKFNNYIYFNPGVDESIDFICTVVKDIVMRYDVDAIHMDDYFYPYPSPGLQIPDQETFKNNGRGFTDIEDWRRDNVNRLIQALSATIKESKPWVRFGISPFGIYRNNTSHPDGSATNGTENYDDLYADIMLWVNKGWVDYNIPQIYWEMGHAQADYVTLAKWWAAHKGKAELYYGQDVARTMKVDQLTAKMRSVRELKGVGGYCFWPANELFWNNKGVADSLKTSYFKYPALIPPYTRLSTHKPHQVSEITMSPGNNGKLSLTWGAVVEDNVSEGAHYFVVYAFPQKSKINLSNSKNIIAITPYTFAEIDLPAKKMTYVVTAVNRYHIESKGRVLKVDKKNLKRLR